MSAQIIQFPGNLAGGAQRPESGLQALIEIDQMQDYRIWSIETQRCFADGMAELAFMVRSYVTESKPPKPRSWRHSCGNSLGQCAASILQTSSS